MSRKIYSIITATGSYIPTRVIHNKDFHSNLFYDNKGKVFDAPNEEITDKFYKITDIIERRHVTDDLVTSDIALLAARETLTSSGIDKETLDYIIVAHNFGDVKADSRKSDIVPSIASRVKQKLGISNPGTIPYDVTFGCPGWLQALIQADYFIRSGDAKKILVIGAEILSRVSDKHDRDSMIYGDGAGAVIVEAYESENPVGIISHVSRSDALETAGFLKMDRSYNPEISGSDLFLKMDGRKLYEYALKYVPPVVKESIEKAGLSIEDINKVLIHQANAKMDEAILSRLFSLYGRKDIPEEIMPMTISSLGNSSVATLPTLLDLILKENLKGHEIKSGDNLLFASVGAGMNINSLVYKVP
jgi:3-oxoacyl-[acyl-carrier-protein] synthase-3